MKEAAVLPLSSLMNDRIKNLIINLKHLPGVYLMHDKNDRIIYVGKAKDLQKRVSQYFLKPQAGKVFKMVQNVEYFETIITNNEKEALILEMNLIQEHYPRFNVLLKDDKHYPYIAIKKGSDPYLSIKRNDKDKKYIYFGPFSNSSAAYEMINLLNKLFPLRKCKNIPSSPCLYYHLGNCLAPCIKSVDDAEYEKLINQIKSFLKGENDEIRKNIEAKMLEASENFEYEQALEYKKTLDAIKHINIRQNVEFSDRKDRDIFAFSKRENYLSLAVLLYRDGILLGKKDFVVEQFGNIEEQVADLILQFYLNVPTPQEIVINSSLVVELLDDLVHSKVYEVSKGKLHDLVLVASKNANNALDEYFLSARLDDDKLSLLEDFGKTLNINTPLHIELFDNSHLQGSSPVGAMVAFVNGEPAKKLYRKFHIEHKEARDDILSMKEVMDRHYSRLKREGKKLPDLILVDGGLTQINVANEVIANLELNIPVFGLYKNDKHQTEGVMNNDGETFKIEDKSLFFLLTRMQDEVHRFAITFHKDLRKKKMTESILDDIPGLGKKRKEVLNKAYSDINLLKQASLEELQQFLPLNLAIAVYEKIHK